MTHTLCRTCKTLKADVDFLGVRAPFTCIACNTEPLIQGKVCPSCGEFRHVKLFRYPLTLAQAEARGYYNHEERPMHATSKFCSYCRKTPPRGKEHMLKGAPRHYTPADLPALPRAKLLIERERGRLKQSAVQDELDQRDLDRERKRREGGRLGGLNRWEKHDDKRWQWVANELRKELQRVATKMPGLRHVADGGGDTARAKLAFHVAYKQALREARNKAVVGLGASKEGEHKWRDLLSALRMVELEQLWGAIDHMARPVEDEEGGKKKYAKPGRPANVPLLLARRDADLFEGCPVKTRTERVAPVKEEPFKHYVHKLHVDNTWDA
jgi:hypothetical protein